MWGYFLALGDRQLMPTAIKVSLLVGTLNFWDKSRLCTFRAIRWLEIRLHRGFEGLAARNYRELPQYSQEP